MKNQSTTPVRETAEMQAEKIIRKIQKWTEKQYPRVKAITRSQLIIECLIEMAEERKFRTAHE